MSVKGKETINNLKLTMGFLELDYDKFEKGNAAAGTRCRVTLQAIKTAAQELRVDIQETKNAK